MLALPPYQKSFVKLFQKFAQVKGRVALVARRNERNPLSASFFFGPFFFRAYLSERKKDEGIKLTILHSLQSFTQLYFCVLLIVTYCLLRFFFLDKEA